MNLDEKKIRKNIKDNIKKYRTEKNITQKEFAKELNVAASTASAWEQGACTPDIEILFKICKFFDVDINEMVGLEPQNIELSLTDEEYEIISHYRKADELDKILVEKILLSNAFDPNNNRMLRYFNAIYNVNNGKDK